MILYCVEVLINNHWAPCNKQYKTKRAAVKRMYQVRLGRIIDTTRVVKLTKEILITT